MAGGPQGDLPFAFVIRNMQLIRRFFFNGIVLIDMCETYIAGDRQVLFADNVMKLNRSAKLVRRVLIITEVAMYILDSDFYRMRHRFALQASFYLMDEDDASVALASGISWLTDTYIHVHIYVCITYVWLSIRSEFVAAMAVVVLAGLYLNLTFLGHVDSLSCVCCSLLFDSLFAFLKLNCLGERVCRPSRS
jgi:hypothetical protein